jgi:hypothetical protein
LIVAGFNSLFVFFRFCRARQILALSLRHIGVVAEEFAVSSDGMEMFGVLDLETTFDGCRLHADSLIMPTRNDQPAFSFTLGGGRREANPHIGESVLYSWGVTQSISLSRCGDAICRMDCTEPSMPVCL